jgi:hypothetical protein
VWEGGVFAAGSAPSWPAEAPFSNTVGDDGLEGCPTNPPNNGAIYGNGARLGNRTYDSFFFTGTVKYKRWPSMLLEPFFGLAKYSMTLTVNIPTYTPSEATYVNNSVTVNCETGTWRGVFTLQKS